MGDLCSRGLSHVCVPSWSSRHVSEPSWFYTEQIQIIAVESSSTRQLTESWISTSFKAISFRTAFHTAINIQCTCFLGHHNLVSLILLLLLFVSHLCWFFLLLPFWCVVFSITVFPILFCWMPWNTIRMLHAENYYYYYYTHTLNKPF